MTPMSSFLRFVLGFLTFISVSFIITFAVGSYTIVQEQREQTASAVQALIRNDK